MQKLLRAKGWITAGVLTTLIILTCSDRSSAQLVLDGAYITVGGGTVSNPIYMVVGEPSISGISRSASGGHIYTAGQYNFVKWNATTGTGNYLFPFGVGATAADYIPFTFNKTSSASSFIWASTWNTNSQNVPHPGTSNVPAVHVMTGVGDSVTSAIDRFWDIQTSSTTTANITLSYRGSENTTTNPTEQFKAQRWNGATTCTPWDASIGSGNTGVTTGIGTVGPINALSSFSPYVLTRALAPLQVAPTVSVTGCAVLYSGTNITLAANASAECSYSWNTGATTSIITINPTVTTVYTATVTNSSGCTAIGTKTVSVTTGLGSATKKFAMLAGTTITSTPNIFAHGKVGAVSTISNSVSASDSILASNAGSVPGALTDLSNTINLLNGLCGTTISSTLTGQSLSPGIYTINSSAVLDGMLTLTGTDTSGIYIFNINGNLSIDTGSTLLYGNPRMRNIIWNVNGNVTLTEAAYFSGTIVANNISIGSNYFRQGLVNLLSSNSISITGSYPNYFIYSAAASLSIYNIPVSPFATCDSWYQKASVGTSIRMDGVAFSIGTKGYFTSGINCLPGFNNELWEYDPSTNVWTQKANFPGTGRRGAVGFSIGTKGYVGTGISGLIALFDFWEYDPSNNTWTAKTNFPGAARESAVGFGVGTKGYVGTGSGQQDFWEYNPASDTWTQKANFGGGIRYGATGFGLGTKGYIGTGWNGSVTTRDFWEYNPSTDTWVQKSSIPIITFNTDREQAIGFAITTCNKGYIGGGANAATLKDFWEWDQAADAWTRRADMNTQRWYAAGFSIGGNGFVGTGWTFAPGVPCSNDFWQYNGVCYTTGIAGTTTICSGQSTTLTAYGGATYSWAPGGATTTSIAVNPSATTTYSVTGTDASGCTNTATVTVTVNPTPTVTVTSPVSICNGNLTTLTASGASAYAWSPSTALSPTTGAVVAANPTSTVSYTVAGTDANGCSSTATTTITVNPTPAVTVSAPTTICNGTSTTLTASGASTYFWSPSTGLNSTTGATVIASPSASLTYTVTGTDANGCSNTSTVIVTVDPVPVITIASPATLCNGASTTLTANGASTYTWSPTTGLSSGTGSTVTANPTVTTTYTITGTSANGCTSSASVALSVGTTPTITISGTTTLCTTGNQTLTAAGGSTYSWAPGGQTTTSVVVAPHVATQYTVTGTDGNGCTNTATIWITPECPDFLYEDCRVRLDVAAFSTFPMTRFGFVITEWASTNGGCTSFVQSLDYNTFGTFFVVNNNPVTDPALNLPPGHQAIDLTTDFGMSSTLAAWLPPLGLGKDYSFQLWDCSGIPASWVQVGTTDCIHTSTVVACDDVVSKTSATVTSLDDEPFGFDIFPNPAKNNITLSYSFPEDKQGVFELYDVFGKLCLMNDLVSDKKSAEVNISTLSEGIYYCYIRNGKNITAVKKLVITR